MFNIHSVLPLFPVWHGIKNDCTRIQLTSKKSLLVNAVQRPDYSKGVGKNRLVLIRNAFGQNEKKLIHNSHVLGFSIFSIWSMYFVQPLSNYTHYEIEL